MLGRTNGSHRGSCGLVALNQDALIYLNLALFSYRPDEWKAIQLPTDRRDRFYPHDAKEPSCSDRSQWSGLAAGMTNGSTFCLRRCAEFGTPWFLVPIDERLVESYLVDGEYRATGEIYQDTRIVTSIIREWGQTTGSTSRFHSLCSLPNGWLTNAVIFRSPTIQSIWLSVCRVALPFWLMTISTTVCVWIWNGLSVGLQAASGFYALYADWCAIKAWPFQKLYQEAIMSLFLCGYIEDPAEMATFKLDQNLVYRFAMFMHSLFIIVSARGGSAICDTYYYYAVQSLDQRNRNMKRQDISYSQSWLSSWWLRKKRRRRRRKKQRLYKASFRTRWSDGVSSKTEHLPD